MSLETAASLEVLSNELFEWVLSFLDLDDIRNLRLASRTTAYKATQDIFKSHCRSKRVYLTKSGLGKLRQATSQGSRLGCLVRDLTLVGVVYNIEALEAFAEDEYNLAAKDDDDPGSEKMLRRCADVELKDTHVHIDLLKKRRADYETLAEQGTDVVFLSEAFSNIATSNPHGLGQLSLQVVVYRDGTVKPLSPKDVECWKWTFEAASRTFALVMSCIRQSQLPVQFLDVFGKNPESLGCNLPCDALSRFNAQAHDLAAFKGLERLSIAISDPIIYESEYRTEDSGDPQQSGKLPSNLHSPTYDMSPLKSQIMDEDNYSCLATLLEKCPSLKHLDISGYRLSPSDPDLKQLRDSLRHRTLYYLAQMEPLPLLSRLRLAGFAAAHGEDLATFLTAHAASLRTVELNHISITQGSLDPVLSCLTSDGFVSLDSIHLEDLWEHKRLVQFTGDREREWRFLSGVRGGRNVLQQWGLGVKDGIGYEVYRGKAVGKPSVMEWHARRKLEFGGR